MTVRAPCAPDGTVRAAHKMTRLRNLETSVSVESRNGKIRDADEYCTTLVHVVRVASACRQRIACVRPRGTRHLYLFTRHH